MSNLTCEHTAGCNFYLDLRADATLKRLYLDAEEEDGYYRDRCVFGDEIDIEDTMGAIVNYSEGAQLHYTLHSFVPFEGYRVAFNGSKGRLEAGVPSAMIPHDSPNHSERERVRASLDPVAAARGELVAMESDEIRIYPLYGGAYREVIPRASGGHGGGDVRLRDMLFRPDIPDPLGHAAGSRAGALSILTGVAANHSIQRGMPVRIEDLLSTHALADASI